MSVASPKCPRGTRGILQPRTGLTKFALRRRLPQPALADYVSHFWFVTWDLRGQPPHQQRLLPHPVANLSFMPGRSRVVGVVRPSKSSCWPGRQRLTTPRR
ncbi:MAG TPA: DUF6597 domain-containing transcriptional factor [Actinopolymorphaceae bacterium]